MEIEFFGGNCFRIKTKKTAVVIDDNLSKLGGKSIQSDKTVAFYTSARLQEGQKPASRLVIDSPGEFEVGDLTVTGLQVRGHMDEEGTESATVYQFMLGGQTITVLGHVHPDVSAELIEMAGGTEVLVVPVGGHGYTLDSVGAASVVKKIEPGVVIPSHYEMKGLKYEIPAAPLEEFTKIMPAPEGEEPQESFKVGSKAVDDLSTQTKAIVLKVVGK